MILYKYYPCNEYTFRALSEMGLWCSPASNMNDPFDCLGQLMKYEFVTKDDIQSINTNEDGFIECPVNIAKNAYFQLCKSTILSHCFCSLSKDPMNILMWSHYALSHRGIVVGIEIPEEALDSLYKVTYRNNLPNLKDEYFLLFINPEVIEASKIKPIPIFKYLSIKTKDWKYEAEWRFWRGNEPDYLRYGVENLKSIYFGLRCPQETKTLVKSILRGNGVSDDIYHDIKIETDPEIRLTI